MAEPKVYDVTKLRIYVDGVELFDLGEGIGITPKKETRLIQSLYGPVGFNKDPNTETEVTINLKATSVSNTKMRAVADAQKMVSVSIKSEDPASTGFTEISVDNVIFQHAEKKLEAEAPTYEYKGIGYPYNEV